MGVEQAGARRYAETIAEGAVVRVIGDISPAAEGMVEVCWGERRLWVFRVDLEQRGYRVAGVGTGT